MLKVASSKDAYSRQFCQTFGGAVSLDAVPGLTYDLITVAGSFAKGHLPVEGSLREVIRLLKPGIEKDHLKFLSLPIGPQRISHSHQNKTLFNGVQL